MAEDTRSLSGHWLGQYQLLDLLKKGGMADVYRARERDTDRLVAVKVLPAALAADPDYVARFKNEVVQLRKLAHPNIVPIESFGEQGRHFYLVMPLLNGSLRDVLIRQGRVDPHDALGVAAQVASALVAVHALGLIHRDIKPDNILLSDDKVLLTDFGIVRQLDVTRPEQLPTLAGTGLPIGTPQYMAPEQLAIRPVDHRADLYARGPCSMRCSPASRRTSPIPPMRLPVACSALPLSRPPHSIPLSGPHSSLSCCVRSRAIRTTATPTQRACATPDFTSPAWRAAPVQALCQVARSGATVVNRGIAAAASPRLATPLPLSARAERPRLRCSLRLRRYCWWSRSSADSAWLARTECWGLGRTGRPRPHSHTIRRMKRWPPGRPSLRRRQRSRLAHTRRRQRRARRCRHARPRRGRRP